MKTRIRNRLDHYNVHCPTCGNVPHGSEVDRSGHDEEASTGPTSYGIVPADRWESWATDLEIDRGFELDWR